MSESLIFRSTAPRSILSHILLHLRLLCCLALWTTFVATNVVAELLFKPNDPKYSHACFYDGPVRGCKAAASPGRNAAQKRRAGEVARNLPQRRELLLCSSSFASRIANESWCRGAGSKCAENIHFLRWSICYDDLLMMSRLQHPNPLETIRKPSETETMARPAR